MKAYEFLNEGKDRPKIDIEWEGNFIVKAYINGAFAGIAEFANDDDHGGFYAIDTSVKPEYRRMGVATAMYDSAMEHFDGGIVPSHFQTADAKAFWKSYES
jgi:ribosomal protein S18 acetylase RimI-like enzyme